MQSEGAVKMKRLISALVAVSLLNTVGFAAKETDNTVNGLRPCNSYDNAIYRAVMQDFADENFGRVTKGDNGNFFVTVGGVPREFSIEDNSVVAIGLRDNQERQELGDVGEGNLYSFESPLTEETVWTEPPTLSDYEVYVPDESTPSMPDLVAPPTEGPTAGSSAAEGADGVEVQPMTPPDLSEGATDPMQPSEPIPVLGPDPVDITDPSQPTQQVQAITGISLSDELFTGLDKESAKTAISNFYTSAPPETQDRLQRWVDTRPLISEMSQSGQTLVGKVKGIVNEYAITINEDGTLTLEETAWMEFPQWSALKR
jgi:hypothetical protein